MEQSRGSQLRQDRRGEIGMSLSTRAEIVLLGLVLSGLLAPVASAEPTRKSRRDRFFPLDQAAGARMAVVQEHLRKEKWTEAIAVLRQLLDEPADKLIELKEGEGKTKATRYVLLQTAANRLVAGLPPAGREHYLAVARAQAPAQIKEARDKADIPKLRALLRRYPQTPEALEILGLLSAHESLAGHEQSWPLWPTIALRQAPAPRWSLTSRWRQERRPFWSSSWRRKHSSR